MFQSQFSVVIENFLNGLNANQANPSSNFPTMGNLSPSLSGTPTLSAGQAISPDPSLVSAAALSAAQLQQAEQEAENSPNIIQAKQEEAKRRLQKIQAGIKTL